MSKIILTDSAQPRLIDTSPGQPLLDPAMVAAALGAEATGVQRPPASSPITVYALRQELFRQMLSPQPPQPDGVVQVSDTDWLRLKELADSFAKPGFTPTVEQVVRALLRVSIRHIEKELSSTPLRSELAEEITPPAA